MIFIMLTRLVGKEVHPLKHTLEELEEIVEKKILQTCPEVKWLSNYALLGVNDYLDIFTAPDLETAMKVSKIVRSFGHASTEVWPAIEWEDFKKVIAKLPEEKN